MDVTITLTEDQAAGLAHVAARNAPELKPAQYLQQVLVPVLDSYVAEQRAAATADVAAVLPDLDAEKLDQVKQLLAPEVAARAAAIEAAAAVAEEPVK